MTTFPLKCPHKTSPRLQSLEIPNGRSKVEYKNLRLISLPVSPWSERAKFALKVAGLMEQIEVIDYTPLMDEWYLRYILGVWNPL